MHWSSGFFQICLSLVSILRQKSVLVIQLPLKQLFKLLFQIIFTYKFVWTDSKFMHSVSSYAWHPPVQSFFIFPSKLKWHHFQILHNKEFWALTCNFVFKNYFLLYGACKTLFLHLKYLGIKKNYINDLFQSLFAFSLNSLLIINSLLFGNAQCVNTKYLVSSFRVVPYSSWFFLCTMYSLYLSHLF